MRRKNLFQITKEEAKALTDSFDNINIAITCKAKKQRRKKYYVEETALVKELLSLIRAKDNI